MPASSSLLLTKSRVLILECDNLLNVMNFYNKSSLMKISDYEAQKYITLLLLAKKIQRKIKKSLDKMLFMWYNKYIK